MPEYHTLVMSDFHLGSKVCRADKILKVLERNDFDTLVVNGDLFDSNTTKKLSKKHWEVLSRLAEIAKTRKVLLIGGNHGRKLDHIAKDIGIEIREEYAFAVSKKQFLCLHGDEFDIFVKYFPFTSDMFGRLYYLIQKLAGRKQKVSVMTKLLSKKILRISPRQKRLAIERGKADRISVVICSHTHIPYLETKDGVLFINTGSFCSVPSTYVTISKDGVTELKEI